MYDEKMDKIGSFYLPPGRFYNTVLQEELILPETLNRSGAFECYKFKTNSSLT